MPTTFDKATELKAAAAVTTTTDETLVLLAPRKMGDRAKVVINVTAVSGTAPTLAPYINVSPTVGGAKTKVAQLPNITAVGQYEIPLSGMLVSQHVPTAEAIGIGWTVGGTTPSFTVEAFIAFEG
jgi:hypothetical protein